MKRLFASLFTVLVVLGFTARVSAEGVLGNPRIRFEITGECGGTRLIFVHTTIDEGIVHASNRAFLAVRTVITLVQQGSQVGMFEAFAGVSNPFSTGLAVPFNVAGVVDVRASMTLLLIDRKGQEHVVASQVVTASALDVHVDPAQAIYGALKLEEMQTLQGQISYARGEEIRGTYTLVNRSEHTLCIPSNMFYPEFHTVGVAQHWLLRLGSDSVIPNVPPLTFRDDSGRYAAGGQILVTDVEFADHLWPPAARLTREWVINNAGDFPIGQYRFFNQQRKEPSDITPRPDVIQEASVDLTIY